MLSALCSAAGENLAAVAIRHSLAEAVLHLALTLFGLVSSFHRYPSISDFHCGGTEQRNVPLLEKRRTCPYFYNFTLYNTHGGCVNCFFIYIIIDRKQNVSCFI